MPEAFALAGQALLYAAFAACIGWFSSHPVYHPLEADEALVKLSFSHAAQRKAPCRERSAEELQKLAPNMRAPLDCPRERWPVTVELTLDGKLLTRAVANPGGVARDGPATLYARYQVPAGEHRIGVRVNDDGNVEGFTHQREETLQLAPQRVLVVDFNPGKGGILLQ